MTAAEALALHHDVHGIQRELITLLADAEPDLNQCQILVAKIDGLFAQLPTVEQLPDLLDAERHALLAAAKTTAQLLHSYYDTMLHLRQSHATAQLRVERDNTAIRSYQAHSSADDPKFLDEKR